MRVAQPKIRRANISSNNGSFGEPFSGNMKCIINTRIAFRYVAYKLWIIRIPEAYICHRQYSQRQRSRNVIRNGFPMRALECCSTKHNPTNQSDKFTTNARRCAAATNWRRLRSASQECACTSYTLNSTTHVSVLPLHYGPIGNLSRPLTPSLRAPACIPIHLGSDRRIACAAAFAFMLGAQ